MITYVKSQEAKLFEIAAEKLGINQKDLTVDEYLNRLSELYALSPRFVRLPLYEDGHEDEEIFEIDANARTITVPASFAKNGVGVVSDELAETLWFKINRYFDIKDFGLAAGVTGNTDVRDGELHILIEWEAPDGTKSASWAYAIDADTDPDYIYFGWALTKEHLTAKAGQIKFAVRILQYNADGLAYSFATQTASVAIKSTLEFDVLAEDFVIESVADKISNRIMHGQIAFCPIFVDTPSPVEGEPATPGDLPEYLASLDSIETTRLTVNAEAPRDESYDAMAYIWYKKGKDDTEFHEVTDADGAYTPSLAVTSSGQYYVVVYGMKEIIDNTAKIYNDGTGEVSEEPFWYHTSVSSTKSTVCEIPMPTPLEIKVVPAESLIMPVENNEQTLVIELKGQQIIGTDTEVGLPGLRVEKTLTPAEVDLNNNMPEFEPYRLQEGQVTFVKTEGENPEYKLIFNTWTTETIETPSEEEGGEPTIETIQTDIDQAYYRFTVQNALNGDIAETEGAIICRITHPAIAAQNLTLKLMDASGTASSQASGSISLGNKLKADHVDFNNTNSDGVKYEWFERYGDVINHDETSGDPVDMLITGATEQVYVPTRPGAYYARVTNEFNNTQTAVETEAIVFNA